MTDKFNYNLGIQNGLFSSWAEAIASAQEKAVGVMFNGLFGDSHNYADIGDGAHVTVGGDLQIVSDTANDTINFVGSPLIPFNATAGQGVGLAFMVTGYINDTTARINPLATIDAGSLLVFANNRGRNISIGVQGGLPDGGDGFNGAFTASFVDNRTVAKVSPAADITLGSGLVLVPIAMETLRQNFNMRMPLHRACVCAHSAGAGFRGESWGRRSPLSAGPASLSGFRDGDRRKGPSHRARSARGHHDATGP